VVQHQRRLHVRRWAGTLTASVPPLERAHPAQPRRLGITVVWRDALVAFSAHPAAILFLAFAGFEVLLILRFMAIVSAALIGAIALALSTVYDAQLFNQMQRT